MRANSISAETVNSSWETFLREEYNWPLLPAHWEITTTTKKKKNVWPPFQMPTLFLVFSPGWQRHNDTHQNITHGCLFMCI